MRVWLSWHYQTQRNVQGRQWERDVQRGRWRQGQLAQLRQSQGMGQERAALKQVQE